MLVHDLAHHLLQQLLVLVNLLLTFLHGYVGVGLHASHRVRDFRRRRHVRGHQFLTFRPFGGFGRLPLFAVPPPAATPGRARRTVDGQHVDCSFIVILL